MPAVSVIMPVYNSEKFLNAAIESVRNQTFSDWELLLIDDGSSDTSGSICDSYAALDNRVRVFHQENRGICGARNRGLDEADGEYICFIDNDDVYNPSLLEKAYTAIVQHHAEVVKFGYHVTETFPDGGSQDRDTVSKDCISISGKNRAQLYTLVRESGFFNMIWNGLYSRKFLCDQHLRFDDTIQFGYEDWIFNYELYMKIEKAIILNEVYYLHEQREGFSTSKKFRTERPYNCATSATVEMRMFDSLGIEKEFPSLRIKRLIEYLIEILLLFSLQDCDWSTQQKKLFIRKLAKKTPYDYLCSINSGVSKHLTIKRRIIYRLFRSGATGSLLRFSVLYGYILRKKKSSH